VYTEICERFGSIDAVISNTGGLERLETIDSLSPENLLHELDHLVGGAYSMLRNALPYLRKSRAPRVVFMTSPEGMRGGTEEGLATSIAKGGVWALAKICAARLAGEGITVNCVSKGAIDKPMPPLRDGEPPRLEARDCLPGVPVGRLGTPEDVAQAVCYLLSEEASYVTGTAIDVAGGLNVR